MNNECGIFELPYVRQGQDCTNSWRTFSMYRRSPLSHGLDERVIFPVHRAIFLSSLCGVITYSLLALLATTAAAGVPLYLSSFLRTVTLVYSLHRVFVLG
jgi:hypothetical protein